MYMEENEAEALALTPWPWTGTGTAEAVAAEAARARAVEAHVRAAEAIGLEPTARWLRERADRWHADWRRSGGALE